MHEIHSTLFSTELATSGVRPSELNSKMKSIMHRPCLPMIFLSVVTLVFSTPLTVGAEIGELKTAVKKTMPQGTEAQISHSASVKPKRVETQCDVPAIRIAMTRGAEVHWPHR